VRSGRPKPPPAIASQEGLDDWLGRAPVRLREFTLCLIVGRAVNDWHTDEQWPPEHPFVEVAERTVELVAAGALMPQRPGDALLRRMSQELHESLTELTDSTINRVADVLVACLHLIDVARAGSSPRPDDETAKQFARTAAERAAHAYPPDPARWQRERETNYGLASRVAVLGEQAATLLRLGHTLEPALSPLRLLEWCERAGDAGRVACDLIAEKGWSDAALDEVRRLVGQT
jgi:hypothetical protein